MQITTRPRTRHCPICGLSARNIFVLILAQVRLDCRRREYRRQLALLEGPPAGSA